MINQVRSSGQDYGLATSPRILASWARSSSSTSCWAEQRRRDRAGLPQAAPAQRAKGIIWGTAGAIVLRVVLIAFAMTLLSLPFLKFVGALLLVWIGVKLLAPDEDGHGDVQGSDKLLAAIKTTHTRGRPERAWTT